MIMDWEQTILFEDNHILAAVKPQNMPAQEDASGDPDFLNALKGYLKEKYQKPGNVFLGLVHRLDRPTGGVMVFAKTSKAAARLSAAIREGDMEKEYLAVTVKKPPEERAHLVHYLKKNTINNTVYVVPQTTAEAKRAELIYTFLQSAPPVHLLKVELLSGRSPQIRVQLSHIGCPIFGDLRYGGAIAKGYNLALWACKLKFTHPVTGDRMVFVAYPPEEEEPWKRFDLPRFLKIYK